MRTKAGNGPNVDLERLLEDIRVVVRDGQELLKHGVSGFRERARISAKTTDRAVRENPYETIGIVFGLGLILGIVCYSVVTRRNEVVRVE